MKVKAQLKRRRKFFRNVQVEVGLGKASQMLITECLNGIESEEEGIINALKREEDHVAFEFFLTFFQPCILLL